MRLLLAGQQGCLLSPLQLNIVLVVPASAIKGRPTGKKDPNLPLFAWDMMVHL